MWKQLYEWLKRELFDRHFTMDTGNHDIAMRRIERSIDHQNIVRVNASTDHGFTLDAHEKRRGRTLDAQLIEIKGVFDIVLGRGRKPSRHTLEIEWNMELPWRRRKVPVFAQYNNSQGVRPLISWIYIQYMTVYRQLQAPGKLL